MESSTIDDPKEEIQTSLDRSEPEPFKLGRVLVSFKDSQYPDVIQGLKKYLPDSAAVLNSFAISSKHLSFSKCWLMGSTLLPIDSGFVLIGWRYETGEPSLVEAIAYCPDVKLDIFSGVLCHGLAREEVSYRFNSVNRPIAEVIWKFMRDQGDEKFIDFDGKWHNWYVGNQIQKETIVSKLLLNAVEPTGLTEEDAATIYSAWECQKWYLLENIVENVRLGYGAGVRCGETGRLISWCGQHRFGHQGPLMTLPNYSRRGYATQVVSAVTFQCLQNGLIPTGSIAEANQASRHLCEALGFQSCGQHTWILLPKAKGTTIEAI